MKTGRIAISVAVIALLPAVMSAQPQRRIQEQQAARQNPSITLTERARAQYPVQATVPSEVNWKRDIYRELDLKKEVNAALYYPEEPLGDRVNFFTLVFRLIIDGKIPAYEYRLDGNELFTDSNKVDVGSLLEKFYVYYEEKDGKYIVSQTDIPSSEVLKYYIKESNFLDQRTSDYQTRVTAVCPVIIREDIGSSFTQYPMFWLNYDDIRPYLSQTRVMTSSLNNTTNMSLDDYFVMRCYDGEIYKTSNLHNRPLAEYCETDTLLKAEQSNIEKQLLDFEAGLWASAGKSVEGKSVADSIPSGRNRAKENKAPAAAKPKKAPAPKPQRQARSTSAERVSLQRTR